MPFFGVGDLAFFNSFQSSDAFCVETSHLTSTENQTTASYMICNTGLKMV